MEHQQNDNSTVIVESIKKVLDDTSFYKVFSHATILIRPSFRKSITLLVLGISLYIFLYYNSSNTITCSFSKIIELSNTIAIALLAMVITGYAIFQAMISNEAVITLLSQNADDNNTSLFLNYQYFFFILSMLYLFIILINFLLSFIFSIYPEILSSIPALYINFIVTLYLLLNIFSFVEFKSFIYNIYQTISLTVIYKTIDRLNKNN